MSDSAITPDYSTPLWRMVVDVLREFPRPMDTILWGIDVMYGEKLALEIVHSQLCRLVTRGFVALSDASAEPLVGYKLTYFGLALQGGDFELCPYCRIELVIDGEGWRRCGACDLVFYSRASETDETCYHLYDGASVLLVFKRRLPPMPENVIACPVVPQDGVK